MEFKNILLIPGIAFHILSYIDESDKGLQSMFTIFNNETYREDIKPFMHYFIQRRMNLLDDVKYRIVKIMMYGVTTKYKTDTMNVLFMSMLYSLYYKYRGHLFQCEEALAIMYNTFPKHFHHALMIYRDHYALECKTLKRNQYNKVFSRYYVKSIDDIHSYPLHVNPCIYISECVCIHDETDSRCNGFTMKCCYVE